MAVACRHAVVPPNGAWIVVSAHKYFGESYSASVDLFLRRMLRGTTRVHQENGQDASERFGVGPQASKGASTMSKKNLGSKIDDFLREENIFEEAQAQAVKEVVSWQLSQAMKKKKVSKARMAVLLKTSRSQVDRILDPKRDITLSSLQRAAALVGHRVLIELV
jgi:antitoxin HicB